MKYFIRFNELPQDKRENYVEFQISNAVKKFWDEESLYIESKVLTESGFYDFISECAYMDAIFDADTISKDETEKIWILAARWRGTVTMITDELFDWAVPRLDEEGKKIIIIREYDRKGEKTMSGFEKIIGYETVKNELKQICDMVHNRELYEKIGAKLPSGLLLYGAPGLGKTVMAKSLIQESGLQSYTIRRNKASGDFVEEITKVFKRAKENAPSIVFLDDMDKFSNEDNSHCDAQEYVAVQSGIDEVRESGVFVVATVNDMDKLPDSLTRCGRFDRKIEICCPTENDAAAIIKHYLKSKKISDDVNLDDVTKMISYSSCAELETILNEAAVCAAFERHSAITTEDIIKAALKMHYNAYDDYSKTSDEDLRKVALHEAGHLVVCETLYPGSIGLASIRSSGRDAEGGFIHRCKELDCRMDDVLILLAGKAAVELYYSETHAEGCMSDILRASRMIRNDISEECSCGFGMIDVANRRFPETSENLNSRNEAVVHALLECYMTKCRDILLKNRDFLEKTAEHLFEKKILLNSDVALIREKCTKNRVAIS